MFVNARQRKAMFARLANISSLLPDDADLKDKLNGRYVSLADKYKAPERLLMQNNAFGIDVGGVLVTKHFIPKFNIFDASDYFKDAGRNTIYVVNTKDLSDVDFDKQVERVKQVAVEQQLKVESTSDPAGF